MRRVSFFFLLFLLFNTQNTKAETLATDYWTYAEYLTLHPNEALTSQAFADRVRQTAVIDADQVKKTIKIAIVYPGKQASDYWRRSLSSFDARLRKLNIPYEIHPYFTKPGTEIRLQERIIKEAIKSNPDYLIFTLDALRHQTIIKTIIQTNKTKLILQNITSPLKAWGDDQPFMYVGFDHATGSNLLAEEFMRRFPKRTPYALFYGTRGYVSTMRGGSFIQTVSSQHGSKLTDSFTLEFDRARAEKATEYLITRNKLPPFIFSCSTDMSLGIIDAAKKAGVLNQIAVNGWGGGSGELNALQKGELDFTVMRMNDDNGIAMAEAVYLDKTNRVNEVPEVYSGDIVLITNTMKQEEIQALKNRAFRYSDHWVSDTNKTIVFKPE